MYVFIVFVVVNVLLNNAAAAEDTNDSLITELTQLDQSQQQHKQVGNHLLLV